MSGYTQCPCCGDDTISSDMAKPELCELCEAAGCEIPTSDDCDCQVVDEELED